MMRRAYLLVLRLHPAAFRERFGEEMLEIFENAPGLGLLADGVASMFRQWVLRPEFRQPIAVVAAPLFGTIDPYRLGPAALFQGCFLTAVFLSIVAASIGQGGRARAFLIGAHQPRPAGAWRGSRLGGGERSRYDGPVWGRPRGSVASDCGGLFQVHSRAGCDGFGSGSGYFVQRDGYRVGDAAEAGWRPRWQLECGGVRLRRRRSELHLRNFMGGNPVLAALDSDHDGQISAGEIRNSAMALRGLDRNGDGRLTVDELIPIKP